MLCRDTAVGHVPYMVALDRKTTSVVVAIRGTMSFADLATDAMALPECIWDWLPDSLRKVLLIPCACLCNLSRPSPVT